MLGSPQTTPGKISAAADRIAAIWSSHQDDEYFDPGGVPDPVRGSLQLVFCDPGILGPGWNAYDELRDQFTGHGLQLPVEVAAMSTVRLSAGEEFRPAPGTTGSQGRMIRPQRFAHGLLPCFGQSDPVLWRIHGEVQSQSHIRRSVPLCQRSVKSSAQPLRNPWTAEPVEPFEAGMGFAPEWLIWTAHMKDPHDRP